MEWALIIILIIVLLLFGAHRLPDHARRMAESISEKSGKQRQPISNSRAWWLLVLTLIAAWTLIAILSLPSFSGEQKLVLDIVLLGWIGVGYWSFGRK